MAVVTKAGLKKLKKQLTASKRKEKAARNKLRAALVKAKKQARVYQRKLELQSKESDKKVAAATSAVYAKLAKSIQKKAKGAKVKKVVKVKKEVSVKRGKKVASAKKRVRKIKK